MENRQNKNFQVDPRDVYPLYPKSTYRSAAKRIREALQSESRIDEKDENSVENWRASHRHILNAWQVTLKTRCHGHDVVFAQRLKRRSTIFNKLCRETTMSLVKMHDIAGCRLIFKNYDDMADYIYNLHRAKKIKHKLTREYDYIKSIHPQNTGYRGIHDEYMYYSRKASDRSDRWDGLYLEIQFRTIYQHAWATAVEVADNLNQSSVKFNNGSEDQKDFFRLASEIIARVYEAQNSCYPELTDIQLASKFENIEAKINLLHRLKQIKTIKENSEWKKNNIILRFFQDEQGKPKLVTYAFDSFSIANKEYFGLEKKFPLDDIVLVRTNDSMIGKSIKDAFRNYFSDATDFVEYIENGLNALKGLKDITPFVPSKQIFPVGIQGELNLKFNP